MTGDAHGGDRLWSSGATPVRRPARGCGHVSPSVPRSPALAKRFGVTGLGALTVDLIKRDDLMVPTAKSLTGPVAAPNPNANDRYKCYGVKVLAGLGNRDVLVADQFGPAKNYDLGRPTRLGVPVSKDGDGLES